MPVSVRQRPQFRFPVQGAFPEPDRALPDPQPGLRGQGDHFRREFHAPGPERQLFRRLPGQAPHAAVEIPHIRAVPPPAHGAEQPHADPVAPWHRAFLHAAGKPVADHDIRPAFRQWPVQFPELHEIIGRIAVSKNIITPAAAAIPARRVYP